MLVSEVMTGPVVTVPESAPIRQAIRVLYEHDLTAAPVVDADGRMVGIVSEADLLRGEFTADPRAFTRPVAEPGEAPPARVREVMTSEVLSARENTDVASLAERMMAERVKSVPVLDGGRLVGMVSRRDLMRVLTHSDDRVCDDVAAALEGLVPGASGWDIVVRNGVVTLTGSADALTDRVVSVLARTVPGVSRVTVIDSPRA
ncbi:CBS domain-containing protein [Actinocorallia sp. B10E7]|uniref:CBS domain-containing protein n=1 Tax=Actinocorallia sp. B10E7 TaxID=3153558 RepID=UPI00325E7D05